MYARDLAASLLRRWYLVVAAFLVTNVVCYVVVSAIAPTYQSATSVVLIPPKNPDAPGSNRYLALSDLSQATGVLMRALNSGEVHDAVARSVPQGDFVVTPDYTTSAPILVITATAHSVRSTERLLDAAVRQVPLNLDRLQARVNTPTTARITAIPVTRASRPSPVLKRRVRAGVAVEVGLMGVLLLAIGAFDGLVTRRQDPEGPERTQPESISLDPSPIPVDQERRDEPPAANAADGLFGVGRPGRR